MSTNEQNDLNTKLCSNVESRGSSVVIFYSVASGNLVEMLIVRCHPRPPESGTLGGALTSPPDDSNIH